MPAAIKISYSSQKQALEKHTRRQSNKRANQQRYLRDIIFISRDPIACGDSGSLIAFRHPFTGEINSFKISS
jgi:hypothetical protein